MTHNFFRLATASVIAIICTSAMAQSQAGSTVKTLAESSLLGAQLAAKQDFKRGALKPAQFDCVQSVQASEMYPLFAQLVYEQLTPAELNEADFFFSSAVGLKYTRHGLAQIHEKVGEPPPEPAPSFSQAEYKQLESFAASAAGQKLIGRNVLQSAATRALLGAKIRQLIERCQQR